MDASGAKKQINHMPADQNKTQETQKRPGIPASCQNCRKPCLKISLMSNLYHEAVTKDRMNPQNHSQKKIKI
jgi:hypothetical protein